MKIITKLLITITVSLMSNSLVIAQCANSANIYSFTYNGKTYEIIKENKTWIDAAACAVERGGILSEINNLAEQNAIFNEVNLNASINTANTVAPDGGGGSYVWIGGNDLSIEGNWVWDGNNDNNSTPFWLGTATGSPVGGLYNNWGNEPDDFNGQDALGLSLDGWPLGSIGQWNDVDRNNTLYYIVEYSTILKVEDIEFSDKIKLFPNPAANFLTVETNEIYLDKIIILNALGQTLTTINIEDKFTSKIIDLSRFKKGIYFIKIISKGGKSAIKKITK